MLLVLSHWLALSYAGCALAKVATTPSNYMIKEIHDVPLKWTRLGPAPPNEPIDLHIVLRQGSRDEIDRHANEVSDPSHERYGQHLAVDEVHALLRPADETLDGVHAWLAASGVDAIKIETTPANDWLTLTIDVAHAERLLDTKYSVFEHEDGTRLIRTPQWSLPEHLHEHIVAVQPTNSFLRAKSRQLKAGASRLATPTHDVDLKARSVATHAYPPHSSASYVAKLCNNTAVTPNCLRYLYNTIGYKPTRNTCVAFGDFLNNTSQERDLRMYIELNRPDIKLPPITQPIVHIERINGGTDFQNLTAAEANAGDDVEGNFNAQFLTGITYPIPLYAYNTGGSPPFKPDGATPENTNEPYGALLSSLLKREGPLPQTISFSYSDDEQTVPPSFAQAVCDQFKALGARGVTVLFSSGDAGVGPDGECVSNNGKKTPMFIPQFPASCPWVTTVGGTTNFQPEIVMNDPYFNFTSGGGFSNYFARPSWQTSTVNAYQARLAANPKAFPKELTRMYNHWGRAYPDVAAQGQRYIVFWNETEQRGSGTSASSPTMAGVIALVNDALVAKGYYPLGFMNPFLYQHGHQAFTDITIGSTMGCQSHGFPALPGWDAATGFGTPDFEKLLTLAMQYGKRIPNYNTNRRNHAKP